MVVVVVLVLEVVGSVVVVVVGGVNSTETRVLEECFVTPPLQVPIAQRTLLDSDDEEKDKPIADGSNRT